MLSQPLANYLAPPPAVCHMPMTPSLKHSASMRAARGNMLWEAPESTPLSLLSQMSSGSNANVYNKRHKRLRANSFDEFGLGILDKEDEDHSYSGPQEQQAVVQGQRSPA